MIFAVGRIESGKHHRLQGQIARQGLHGRLAVTCKSVAHTAIPDILETGGDIPHLTRINGVHGFGERREYAHFQDISHFTRGHDF